MTFFDDFIDNYFEYEAIYELGLDINNLNPYDDGNENCCCPNDCNSCPVRKWRI